MGVYNDSQRHDSLPHLEIAPLGFIQDSDGNPAGFYDAHIQFGWLAVALYVAMHHYTGQLQDRLVPLQHGRRPTPQGSDAMR